MEIKVPDNEHDKEFVELVVKMCEVKFDATKRYGPVTGTLGVKGLFCDLNRKYQRIKRYLWDQQMESSSEEIEDTLFDNAIYSLLVIMELRKEKDKSYP